MSDDHIALSREVSEALASNQAVVTLESTVIAQGLPWPANFETALARPRSRAWRGSCSGDNRRARRIGPNRINRK
jgi:pseudouridine-5'-phosphate glycosidase